MPKLTPEIALTLSDGREVVARLDFEAMAHAEEAADKPFKDIIDELQSGSARLRTQRALFYGMLKEAMPELTVKAAGDLLVAEAKAFEAGMKGLRDTMREAPPADDDGEAGDDAEPDPPTVAAEAST